MNIYLPPLSDYDYIVWENKGLFGSLPWCLKLKGFVGFYSAHKISIPCVSGVIICEVPRYV